MPYISINNNEWEVYLTIYPNSAKPYFVKFFHNGCIEDTKYYKSMKGVNRALNRRFGIKT